MSVPSTKLIDFSNPARTSWADFPEVLIRYPNNRYYVAGLTYHSIKTSHDIVRVKRKPGKPQNPEDDRFEVLEPNKFGTGRMADTRRSIMTLVLKNGALTQHKIYPLPEGARRIFKTQKLEDAEREFAALTLAMPESIKPLVIVGNRATFGMRYFHGPSLYTLLQARMTEEDAIAYSNQMLIAYSEQVLKFGFIFRDLKPEHFLLTEEGRFRVIDYGLAVQSTLALGKAGSPYYMAPEVQFKTADSFLLKDYFSVPASDSYSLGVLLSEIWGGLFNETDKEQYYDWEKTYPRKRREFPNLFIRFPCQPENKLVAKTLIYGLTENGFEDRLHASQVQQNFSTLEYHYSIDVLNLNSKTRPALRQLINSDPGRQSWKHGDYKLTFVPGPNKPLTTRHFSLIQNLESTTFDNHYHVISSTGAILDTLRHSDLQLTERLNLKKLQRHIEQTNWKVGLQLRKTTIQTKDKKILVVPKHVKEIWDLNQTVLSNSRLEIRELRSAESKILALGQKAASRFSLFRKADTKKFYQNFKVSTDFNSLAQRLS